jgi:hypothetical protein
MSITSANAILTLSQPVLFPSGPVQIQDFSSNDITRMDGARILEHQMGVDGILSFGFVFVERMQDISLKAASPSVAFFDTIMTQQVAAVDVYTLTGTLILPSIKKKFNLVKGGLETYAPIPDVAKTLQPQRFRIVWEKVIPIPTN